MKLRAYDKRFYERPGKGSHRILCHDDIHGAPRRVPIPCHSEGDEVKRYVLKECIQMFNLPPDLL